MTDNACPDVSLEKIDTDHLANVEDNREAVEFSVRLTCAPTEYWRQEFEQAYKQTPYTLKPPVRLDHDALHIIFLPRYANELPGFFHFLAMIIGRANAETHRTEELHTSNAQERQKAEFREALRRIDLPKS